LDWRESATQTVMAKAEVILPHGRCEPLLAASGHHIAARAQSHRQHRVAEFVTLRPFPNPVQKNRFDARQTLRLISRTIHRNPSKPLLWQRSGARELQWSECA